MLELYIWFGAAVALFILEILLMASFSLLCFALAATAAGLVALTGVSLEWQILVFALVSLALFVWMRPLFINRLKQRADRLPKTNKDALVGRTARVVEPIAGLRQTGRVMIDGDNWQAYAQGDEDIAPGTLVTVVSVDSIILTVTPSN